jgi:glucuronate isomerase
MERQELYQAILATPVWDTHTHLTPDQLPAQNFWEIGHYFWFLRELQAAGYPVDAEALPVEARIDAYVHAFNTTRNTSMNWVVRHIFRELYGLEITGAASIRAADRAVRKSAADPYWPQHVANKLAIRRICIHDREPREFRDLPGVSCIVPIDANQSWDALAELVVSSPDRRAAATAAAARIEQAVAKLARAGITCMRAPPSPFEALGKAAYRHEPLTADASRQEIELHLGHALYRAMSDHAMVAQLFVGVEPTSAGERIGVDGAQRIPNLHGLFAAYPGCRFELIVGAEGNNLDAVQAARVYGNVHVGGMWWYNFRASTYRQSMQYRFEALPSTKCSLVVSDARCIEWCFGKILLIKRLMADYLSDQVAQGWLDAPGALRVARDWLHDSAAALYAMPGKEGD